MREQIEPGHMVFFREGDEAVAAVRRMRGDHVVVYVENGGEFDVPLTAVVAVHDQKVMLDRDRVGLKLLEAVRHQHDAEDRNLAG